MALSGSDNEEIAEHCSLSDKTEFWSTIYQSLDHNFSATRKKRPKVIV